MPRTVGAPVTSKGAQLAGKRPKDRKVSILRAAAELFAERGFSAVGIDDIGSRVGITGPAIYRHFATKDEVLTSMVCQALERLVDAAEGAPRNETGEARQLVRAVVTCVLDDSAPIAVYLRESRRLGPEATKRVQGYEQRLLQASRTLLRDTDVDLPTALVDLRLRALRGAVAAIGVRRPILSRPRLDDLLTDAGLALLLPQASPPDSEAAGPATSYRAPSTRRNEIIAAAMTLFHDRGFHGVGIDEIGEAAGLSGPTLYYYFDGKADMLLDAYDRMWARAIVGQEEALANATSAQDSLRRIVDSFARVAVESIEMIAVTAHEGDALPEDSRPRMRRRRRAFWDTWLMALRELRPDLADSERLVLIRGVFALVDQAAQFPMRRHKLRPEIAQMALSLMLGSGASSVE